MVGTTFSACQYFPQVYFNWRHSTDGGWGPAFVGMQAIGLTLCWIAAMLVHFVLLTLISQFVQAVSAYVLLGQIFFYRSVEVRVVVQEESDAPVAVTDGGEHE